MWLIFNVSPTFQPRVGGKGQDNRQTVYSTTTDYALDVAAGLPEVIALRTHATTTSDDDRYLHLPGLIVAESAAGDVRYLMPDGAPEDGRGSIRQAAYADGSITVTSLTDDAIDSDSGDVQVMNSAVFGQESGVDTDSGAIEVRNSTVTGLGDAINAATSVVVISSTVTAENLMGILAGTDATVLASTVSGGQDGVAAVASVTLVNSTISGSGRHGVQSLTGQTINIDHSTIADNEGYGIMNPGGTTLLNNSLVANNGGQGTTQDVSGTLNASSRYNLIGNRSGTGLSDGVNGNLVGVTGALLDPGLNPLADNGGPSQTQALQYGSPALDQIPNGVNGCGLTTVTDQRGTGRPQNGARDMGAYESLGFYLSLSGGDNQSTAVNTPFAQPLQVTLVATESNVTVGAGHIINFSAPISGPGLSPAGGTSRPSASA